MIKKENNTVLNKIMNLYLRRGIKESHFYLIYINKEIKFYQTRLKFLKDNKPLFFQKKKLIKYNSTLQEYNNKIENLYIKLEEEMSLIEQLHKL